jgi:hypothetical protein
MNLGSRISLDLFMILHTKQADAGGSKSNDVELLDCTLMAPNNLKRPDQCKIGKKS